jgi:hypothetical protein
MLKLGTSALFLMLEKVTPDKAVEAMSKYGGHRLEDLPVQARRTRTAGSPARPRGGIAIAAPL